MEGYVTIEHRASYEYEDRKSVFIGWACPVSTEEEALAFIAAVKKEYPDARHHVYAYVLRDRSISRFSDDREPQGSAGMPVLDVIRKNGCTDTVIVVVRYFGGVLLGVGGLVRAYTEAAAGALRSGNIITYDIYTECKVSLSYAEYQKFLPLSEDMGFRTDDTDFGADVVISGSIKREAAEAFFKALSDMSGGKIVPEILCEKFSY